LFDPPWSVVGLAVNGQNTGSGRCELGVDAGIEREGLSVMVII